MSEYHVQEKIVYEVLELTEDEVCYVVAEFDTEAEADAYKEECEEAE